MSQKNFSIKKILLPIDFSETAMLAIEHAGFTAQLLKAEIILLHVAEKHWEKVNIISPDIKVEQPDKLLGTIEKRLEEIGSDIKAKYGVDVISITTIGNIFTEILNIAKEQSIDLIVMGTHGASGFVEFFVGSNTYKVTTLANCPVLAIQTHAKKLGFQNIVLPIDNSAHSRQKVQHAIFMANHFGAVIHVVGLVNTDDETEKNQLEVKVEQVEDFIAAQKIAHTKKYISGDNLSKTTLDYAKEINADLIIIMDDQEENLLGRLLGPYSQQIITHSKIPTMCIPPVYGHLYTSGIAFPI